MPALSVNKMPGGILFPRMKQAIMLEQNARGLYVSHMKADILLEMPALSVSKLQKGIMFPQTKASIILEMSALSIIKMPKSITCKM